MDTHMSYKVLYSEQEKYTSNPRNRTLPINCIYPYSSYVPQSPYLDFPAVYMIRERGWPCW